MSQVKIKKILQWIVISTFSGVILLYLGLLLALKLNSTKTSFSQEVQESVFAESKQPHQIKLIDSGITSLYERLKLIEKAQKSIELEFFIFNIDQTSRLVTQALINKAKEGVKIRLLVDFSAPVFQLRPAYAALMKEAGIDVRYYNTSSMYRFFTVQHRSHRKLLIIDGESVLTGGRNIADDYFDLSNHYNFLDSDVFITGPIIKTILASFNLYWNSDWAKSADLLESETTGEEQKLALAYFKTSDEDAKTLEKINLIGREQSQKLIASTCHDILFITDFPGAGESHRKIFPTLVKMMSEVKKEVLIESPYFVLRDEGREVFTKMNARHVDVKVLTNGLYSTDAYYVISALSPRLQWIADSGLELYVYDGSALKSGPDVSNSSRWGIHAKRAVIDQKTALIGTYNIDPRSANLNSELMVACKDNPDFANQVQKSIESRMQQSTKIIAEKKVINEEALFAKASFKQKIMTWLAIPFTNYLDILL